MENLLTRRALLDSLGKLGVGIGRRVLIKYAELGLIDLPSYQGSIGAIHALYPPETLADIYAIHNLVKRERRDYNLIKEARLIANKLERNDYSKLKNILLDNELKQMIFHKARPTFWAYEWLKYKHEALEALKLPIPKVNVDRGLLVGLADSRKFWLFFAKFEEAETKQWMPLLYNHASLFVSV